ncbi:unnamed protein product [Orchesella dallaii]|uniref:Uncharacterized protein n=1 Tax=Orchesella dallaii TaxID=48710 RepID=A0ABP1QB09_9HEXA
MESLSTISQCSKSSKVLASRSSRIPVKVCNTSNKDKHDKQEPLTARKAIQQNAESKPSGTIKSNMYKNSNVVDTPNHTSNVTSTFSPKTTIRDPIIPLPTQESSFTFPRTRVKSPLPSPAESHTNVIKSNLRKDTFPVPQLPNETCSRERINAWVDQARIPCSVSQTNEVTHDSKITAHQEPPVPLMPVETKEQSESCVVLSPKVSMSIIHKTNDECTEAKASENGMIMDNATTTLVEEPIELAYQTPEFTSVQGHNSSDHSHPNEVSPLQNEIGESISNNTKEPASPLPPSSRRMTKVLSESEKDSNPTSSIIPSGYGSSSSSSMQSKISEEQRIPTFLMNHQCQPISSNTNGLPKCKTIAIAPKLSVTSPADPSYCGSLISSVTTARTKTYSKTNNTPTYEDLFYKKKAFIAYGPSAMRSNNRETVPFSPKFTRNQPNNTFINHQQHAALTRVITETVTEYEVQEDKCNERKKTLQRRKRRDSSSRGKSCKKINKSRIPRLAVNEELVQPGTGESRLKAILPTKNFSYFGGERLKNQNVEPGLVPPLALITVGHPSVLETIVEEPIEVENECKESGIMETTENDRHGQKCLPTAYNSDSENNIPIPMSLPRKKPTLTLAGHGDPHLQVPIPGCADRESVTADENDNNIDFTYRDRANYKQLLMDSETTIRYLHKLLAIQEEKLEKVTAKSLSRSDLPSSKRNSQVECRESERILSSSAPQLNPLVLKQQKESESGFTIPKFDMDEFIRKWFHHFWSQDSYYVKNNCKGPYHQSQLFRLSIAARSAICLSLRAYIQNGNRILRHKYDKLKTKIASNDPDSENARIRLVDAYRRFVRYSHHYFKESLKSVEKFDEMYMDQQRDDEKGKILYFHETRLVVQGVRYYGVFLPIRTEAQ